MKKITASKPRFMKIFPKRLLISLVISALLGTAAFLTAQHLYRIYSEEIAQRMFNDVSNDVQNLYLNYCDNIDDEESYNYFITSVAYTFRRYYDMQENPDVPVPACRLIDKNGEVLCSSAFRPMLTVYDKSSDSKPKYYFCAPEIESAVHSKFIEYDNKCSSDMSVICTKAYISGKYFYPRISLCRVNWNTGEWKELEGTDFYPEDTSSLKLIEDNKNADIWYDDYYIEQYEAYKNNKGEKAADEYAASFYVSGDDWHIGSAPDGYLDHMLIVSDGSDNKKGECFYLISVYPCSLFESFAPRVILAGSAVLFLAVCIPLISSLLTYKDKKAQYEIFTARQQTTNAMAHDLKTPLTSIAGFAEMLQSGVNPEKHEHYLTMISKNVEQMNNIVSDILKLAKSESSADILLPEQLSAEDICNDIIKELRGTFEAHKLSCELNVKKNAVINADKKLLTQALSNLLHNAAVYSRPGTTVRVTITEKALCITNTPAQMPKLSADELVKPFVKDDASRGENSGSGVGLSIAKQDLERMGFELKIEITDSEFRAGVKFN